MEFLSRHKRAFFIALILICLASVLLTLGYRLQPSLFHSTLGYVITPVQKSVTNAADWLGEKIHFAANIGETELENIRLREELESLSAEADRIALLELELDILRELYKIDEKYPSYPKVGARIIAKDVGNWYNSYYNNFIIDKGVQDGLDKNMVVMAQGGLAGKITEAGPHYAKVITLIDEISSVSAKSVRTEDVGFVKGDLQLAGSGLCKMEYINATAEIIEGDEIVTSHLSEFYPPGLTIGYVKEIRTDPTGLTKYAIIQPVVDFKRMDTVLVLNQRFHEEYLNTLSDAYSKTQEE